MLLIILLATPQTNDEIKLDPIQQKKNEEALVEIGVTTELLKAEELLSLSNCSVLHECGAGTW